MNNNQSRMPMARAFYPKLPLHLLQSIRVVHALTETDFRVLIKPKDWHKIMGLVAEFGISVWKSEREAPEVLIPIDHKTPSTQVGNLSRPVIFPHSLVDRCRDLWAARRTHRFVFSGLITEQRKEVLEKWIVDTLGSGCPDIPLTSPVESRDRRFRRLFGKFRPRASNKAINVGDVHISSSSGGRRFPQKVWDVDYQTLLANSEFALCPSGDFVWTYRFFEALLCGSIPIVEEACAAYNGCHYFTMDQHVSELHRSPKIVEENFEWCRERITVPVSDLNSELARLLSPSR